MYRSPILPVQPPAPYLSSSGQLGAARVGQEPGPYWVPTSGPGGPPNLMEETDNDNLVSTVLIEVALGRGGGGGDQIFPQENPEPAREPREGFLGEGHI